MHPTEFVDPHSLAHRLRARGEILPISFREEAGFERSQAYAGSQEWTALSYDAVRTVLNDGANFSSRGYSAEHDRKMGASTILSMDDPEHRAHRDLVSAGFFARSVRQSVERTVKAVLTELLDKIDGRSGPVDLVRDLTSIFPIQVIVKMVGVPNSDWPQFLHWVDDLVAIGHNPEAAMKAGAAAQAYLAELVAKRHLDPQDDLASTLVNAEIDGRQLSEPAVVAFLALLLTAGGETTVRAIGTTLVGLLSKPEQYEAVVADRTLVPRALDEGLRWDTPVHLIRRLTVRDTEVAGAIVPAGAYVMCHLGAANRDPARWEDPNRFDIFRKPKPGLSFGYGSHYCLGINLARYEAETALNMIMDRFPDLRLSPNGRTPVIRGLDLRGPDSLDVEFEPAKVSA